MVTEAESHDYPQYALERVRELAASGAVIYGFSSVQNSVASLRYEPSDVCTCLRMLEPRNFQKSVRYDSKGPWLDVYLIQVKFNDSVESQDNLYIKLKLDLSRMNVVLASFHPERYL